MTPEEAAWVRAHILPAPIVDSQRVLMRMCPCQWGPCGRCHHGQHDQCVLRRDPHWYERTMPDTHLCGTDGTARAPVWQAGHRCRWQCPCDCPPLAPPPPAPTPKPKPNRNDQPTLF